jgi:hypothetical protein
VKPVNDRPVVSVSGTFGYKLNTPAVAIAPNATVTDIDNPAHFGGGYLILGITQGQDAGNRLGLGSAFKVVTVNNVRRVVTNDASQTWIGTLANDGTGLRNLRVDFNNAATLERVARLLRSVTFGTENATSIEQREITIRLSDGIAESLPRTRIANATR